MTGLNLRSLDMAETAVLEAARALRVDPETGARRPEALEESVRALIHAVEALVNDVHQVHTVLHRQGAPVLD